ncbi:LOW QUALITY PROTEIN: hypothetical protein U9M48_040489 [Paspalum notatum var. saurae]|uniref:Uncharacterized protein n=1 Tax=Paspalum notatum var. saurae TaxID=547442 RepID=A0AAQ3ULV8_PASNO
MRRSARQCEAFCGEFAGDDGLLVYLRPLSLRLISCNGVTDEGIAEAVKELPLLEELELSLCYNVLGISEVYEAAGEVCPLLKRFRLSKHRFDVNMRSIPNASQGIASMHGLQSLQLFVCDLNNDDLETILDGCLHLESLDIRHCFNVNMDDGTLPLKCARIKTVRGPDDPTDDYDLTVEIPIRTPILPIRFGVRSGYNLDDDSDFYDDEPSSYEIDFEKYEKMLPSSMRTFLKLMLYVRVLKASKKEFALCAPRLSPHAAPSGATWGQQAIPAASPSPPVPDGRRRRKRLRPAAVAGRS